MTTDGTPAGPPDFDERFRETLHQLFAWRRDVRRFRRDPLPIGTVERLLDVACCSPSVGMCQPWRFVVVEDAARRSLVRSAFVSANAQAAADYTGELAARYSSLKLAGLDDAPVHIAVFCDRGTQVGHGLGRRTMPEAADYSVVAAIYTMWLAARAEGIGMGWVSILDPSRMHAILDVPSVWHFIGYLCMGYPEHHDSCPELERAGWEQRRAGVVVRR